MKVERPAGQIVGRADAREQPVDHADLRRAPPARSCPSAPGSRSARSGAGTCSCPPCSARSAATATPAPPRSQSLATKLWLGRAQRLLDHRMPAALDQKPRRRRRPAAGSSAARRPASASAGRDVELGQRRGRGRDRPRRRPAPPAAAPRTARSSSASAPLGGAGDPALQLGQLGGGVAHRPRPCSAAARSRGRHLGRHGAAGHLDVVARARCCGGSSASRSPVSPR